MLKQTYSVKKIGAGTAGKIGITDGWQETTRHDPNAYQNQPTYIPYQDKDMNYVYDQLKGF